MRMEIGSFFAAVIILMTNCRASSVWGTFYPVIRRWLNWKIWPMAGRLLVQGLAVHGNDMR